MTAGAVTVGVATCGRPGALSRCLAGLVASDSRPGEVLVIDQSPSEAARSAVADAGLDRARYLPQARLGLSASRNLALASASLSVLAVTDDDCVPEPGWVGALAGALARAPVPAAVTGAILPLGDGAPGLYAISLRDSPFPADHSGRVPPWIVGSGANFAAPCDLLRTYGGWNEYLGTGSSGKAAEDADLLHRMLRDGRIVRYEPDAVVRHEWQSLDRRLATRWSYGYGVGAMCGIWLRRGDPFVPRMLLAYLHLHARPLLSAIVRADRRRTSEHGRAVASLVPGLLRGLRAPRGHARSTSGQL